MKKKIWKIVFLLSAVALLASLVLLCIIFLGRNDEPRYKNGSSEYDITSVTETELPDNPIDFDEWQQKNADIYAWIKVDGTDIDYPVFQGNDDFFYIHHNIDRKYQFAGEIYTEMQNRTDFSDRNTLVYGHNMKNGTKFAQLLRFRDAEFFNDNPHFYIYTRGHILTYDIFSAYKYDDRHILNNFDFSNDKVFLDYLEFAAHPTSTIFNVRETELDINSKIVTLCTCIGSGKNRFLVQGVLADDTETKQ